MCDQDHFEKDRQDFEALGLVTRKQFGVMLGAGVAMLRDPGSFPDRTKTALLLIDVINDLAFPRSEDLLQALPMARPCQPEAASSAPWHAGPPRKR